MYERLLGRHTMPRKNNTAVKVEEPVETPAAATEVKKVYPTTEQLIASGFTTKSARIRQLHSLGMPIGDISRQETNGLYQHAYNVIKRPLKRPVAELPTPEPLPEDAGDSDASDGGESEDSSTQEA
jgi:arsenate reductase-like glutaredoxin family protein